MRIGLGIGLINKSTTGGAIPPAISSVTISGTSVVGQVLTATASGVTGTPAPTLSYQWKRGATNIGTNSTTYTLVAADAGNTSNITCVVTATNAAGSANATSNQIAQILTVRTSAFLTASAISDATIRGGLNTFDIGLISNSLDTKMKALYPFVADGADNNARALQQRWNFMDARDLDAAFRLSFGGTTTHSSNGFQGNGTNGFADTRLNTLTNLTKTSSHLSFYVRNNSNAGQPYDIGNAADALMGVTPTYLISRYSSNLAFIGIADTSYGTSVSSTDSRGFWTGATNGGSTQKLYKNGVSVVTGTASAGGFANNNLYIGAANANNIANYFTDKQYAFASIGNGLTDTDAANLYTLTQALQTTLGRSVGPQVVSDPDAQAFVTAADIQDQVQANAINTLVIGMKAQGLWTKMKAIYPMVGGTASTHKFNLKNPLDTNAAFRLVFFGSGTHSSNGYLPNGTNAYADTFLAPATVINDNNDGHLSYYSRTDNLGISAVDIGCGDVTTSFDMIIKFGSNLGGASINMLDGTNLITNTARTDGFYVASQNNVNDIRNLYRNTTSLATQNVSQNLTPSTVTVFIGARNGPPNGSPFFFTNRQCAFASVGNGLSATDVTNYYNLVQTFQTTLGRQV